MRTYIAYLLTLVLAFLVGIIYAVQTMPRMLPNEYPIYKHDPANYWEEKKIVVCMTDPNCLVKCMDDGNTYSYCLNYCRY